MKEKDEGSHEVVVHLALFASMPHDARHLFLEVRDQIGVNLADSDSFHQLVNFAYSTIKEKKVTT